MSSPNTMRVLRENKEIIKASLQNRLTDDQIEAYLWMIQEPQIQLYYGQEMPVGFYDFYQHQYKDEELIADITNFINKFTPRDGDHQALRQEFHSEVQKVRNYIGKSIDNLLTVLTYLYDNMFIDDKFFHTYVRNTKKLSYNSNLVENLKKIRNNDVVTSLLNFWKSFADEMEKYKIAEAIDQETLNDEQQKYYHIISQENQYYNKKNRGEVQNTPSPIKLSPSPSASALSLNASQKRPPSGLALELERHQRRLAAEAEKKRQEEEMEDIHHFWRTSGSDRTSASDSDRSESKISNVTDTSAEGLQNFEIPEELDNIPKPKAVRSKPKQKKCKTKKNGRCVISGGKRKTRNKKKKRRKKTRRRYKKRKTRRRR